MVFSKEWTQIAMLTDFGASNKLLRKSGDLCILLCRTGQEIVAIQNVCTHLGKPLDGGRIMAGHITCPFHGASFDLRSGRAISGPAVSSLQTYPVQLSNGDVLVLLPQQVKESGP
jgi:nitrite reductase/ring-hydroxylating ferredoxin subunit